MEPTLEGAMALARAATGPLSPHLPAFVTSLIDQRYAVVCVRAKAWRAAAFDAWLSGQGVDLADLQDAHVDESSAERIGLAVTVRLRRVATSRLLFTSCWVSYVDKACAPQHPQSPSLPMSRWRN